MAEENKWMIALVIGILVVAAGIFIFFYTPQPPDSNAVPEFNKGAKINQETFLSLLSEAKKIYVVMDIRNVSSNLTSRNILECGVDFAGSSGLANRNVIYLSMENERCVAASLTGFNKTTTNADCMDMINSDGMSLYVQQGNETAYYNRAAIIGVGEGYVLGTCSIGAK
ncbi:MAG: hypothetical protein V1492_03885 [Candidatus Micrarchaeota archaeon]